jgi:hypothetical protein
MRLSAGLAACVAFAWSAAVWLTGGTTIAIGGLRLSSKDPIRPLVAAFALTAVYLLSSRRQLVRDDVSLAARVATPARLSAVLAIAIGVIAIWQSSWTASGTDAYAYVSQADRWLEGRLKVPVPIADEVPWPRALSTFVPFGYAAVANESAIASAVGPGLPLLMALMKAIGGHAALFLVVPITAALLIWVTFAIGRQIGSPALGLGAAWLAATSPAFLTMIKEPMSDVPAAAFWAAATWKALDRSRFSPVIAGLAAAMAILIRPNLVPLAVVPGTWILLPSVVSGFPPPPKASARLAEARHARDGGDRTRAFASFAACVVPACLAIAWINHTLFGSPLASGYGATESLFSIGNVWTNIGRYGGWLAETQTPLAVAGVLALIVPAARFWPTPEARRGARLLAAMAIMVFAIYAFYIPFDAWWFLRLLLPCWPALGIGSAALVSAIAGQRFRVVGGLALLTLGLYTAIIANRLRVFPDNEGERRYATIAQLVQQATEPSSLILASIHAGPLRYYAGRDTMRFDLLDEAWLDRAVAWLTAQGRKPYFLIEDWELPIFERRFAARNTLGRLALSPVLAYRAYQIPGTVYLFDPARPTAATWQPPPLRDPRPRCPLPAAPPRLALHTSRANPDATRTRERSGRAQAFVP